MIFIDIHACVFHHKACDDRVGKSGKHQKKSQDQGDGKVLIVLSPERISSVELVFVPEDHFLQGFNMFCFHIEEVC